MRNVIFVAPFPMDATLRFGGAAGRLLDVRLLGVFQQAPPPGLCHDAVLVEDALDPAQILGGVQRLIQRYGQPHRIISVLENIQVQVAQVRAHLGVPGPTPEALHRFRDKGVMKDALRAAGIPCARHRAVTGPQEGLAFAAEVGFPLVLKPPAGAGCRSTWRIDNADALRSALASLRPSPQHPVLAEEFLRGQEFSYEAITVGGEIKMRSLSRYLPTPLEVMETPWIQWRCLLPREIDTPEFADAHRLGAAVIRALGSHTGVTHMEWFRRPDGSLAVGEIALRPPGAQISAMTGLVHGVDFHRAWARAVVDEAFDGPWQRRYAAGVAFFRGPGKGRVQAVRGVEQAQRELGHLVVDAKLPTPGAAKSSSYEGDGYAVLRHPETAVVERALKTLIETVQVVYA